MATDRGRAIALAKYVLIFGMVLVSIVSIVYAGGGTLSETGSVTVPTSCTFSPNTATLGFGSIAAGSNIATTIALTITNTGNTNANILLSSTSTSGNWLYSSNSAFGFLYSNTVYSGGSSVAWGTANKLIFGSASIGTTATGDSHITVR